MDKILVINAVLAVVAIFAGLYSRKLSAALVAWFWLAIVHSGLILLAMGQTGDMKTPDLPVAGFILPETARMIGAGLQMANIDFANTGLLAYFAATIGILFGLVIASFVVSSILNVFVLILSPQKASA